MNPLRLSDVRVEVGLSTLCSLPGDSPGPPAPLFLEI